MRPRMTGTSSTVAGRRFSMASASGVSPWRPRRLRARVADGRVDIMRPPSRPASLAFTAVLSGLAVCAPAADRLAVESHDVGLMDLRTAAAVVRPLLSAEGRVVEDERSRRLIVVDRPDVQRAVAAALRRVVTEARNVRIRVATTWSAESGQAGGSVRVGRRPRVSAGARDSRSSVRAEQQLL